MSKFINYLGNKSSILDFISSGIDQYLYDGDTVLDLFAGSGVVSYKLSEKYNVISNDSEAYSSTICSAQFNIPHYNANNILDIKNQLLSIKSFLISQENLSNLIQKENKLIQENSIDELNELYKSHKTVWNSKNFTPQKLRSNNNYNLFLRYYAGSYFGIEQALEIDSIIKFIKKSDCLFVDFLYSKLFLTINNVVFSRDGHMAQPLELKTNSKRAILDRSKNVFDIYLKYLEKDIDSSNTKKYNYKTYNLPFDKLISRKDIIDKVDLVYADPPYTDMQYSRYYHILNVAVNYDYPEMTKIKNGYTKGLYTEGRFQSSLSQKSKAKEDLYLLMKSCFDAETNLALSYAYPRDIKQQKTNRYTVSIEELMNMAKEVFSPSNVHVEQIDYFHSNNKNDQRKPVIEYLILCGKNKKKSKSYNITKIKKQIDSLKPTNRNEIYNTHIYWSQKSFNIIDSLIENLSEENDVIFDPFMGSGVTILESITNNMKRNAIGCDINEAPVFIVKTLVKYSKDKQLRKDLIDISHQINSLMHYYEANCPNCDSISIIDRIIFDKANRDSKEININAVNHICEKCGKVVESENIKNYQEDMFSKYELENIDKKYEFIENSKVAVIKNDSIFNIFTNRNLKILDDMLEISKQFSKNTESVFKYILMSCMHQCKITDKRSNSQWPLWTPKKDCVERNVVLLVNKKINNFLKALPRIQETYVDSILVDSFNDLSINSAFLLQKPSQYISNFDIPDNSIDLVITDPPYLGQVLYSEYMQLYSPILGLSIDMKDEIVISSRSEHDKNEADYFEDLKKAFSLIGKKLKKDKVMCLYFHDNSLKVWNKLMKILFEEGFRYIGQTHIEKSNTLKNIISPKKSLKGDSILFFRNSKHKDEYRYAPEEIEEIEINIIKEAKYMLKNQNQLTSADLYDNGLMETLISNAWLGKLSEKYTSLIDLLQEHLKWNSELAVWENNNNEKI